MKSVIYHAFSPKEAKDFDVQPAGAQRAEAFVQAFLKRSLPGMSQEALEDQLQRKAVVLEYFTRQKRKEKKKKSKGLSARQRRELRLFDIKPEQQRYSLFLPLHELWKQYIRDLCNGLKADTQPQMIQAKLLKADLHGAVISVTKSKCPSYVGVTGILLQETKHVFKIVTKEDCLKGTKPHLRGCGLWAEASLATLSPLNCGPEEPIWCLRSAQTATPTDPTALPGGTGEQSLQPQAEVAEGKEGLPGWASKTKTCLGPRIGTLCPKGVPGGTDG
ncbi:ribonuclease P protein subunit p29 isoform X1 [Elephas maximus indicus]|uniref:ribonuclease P protein subunit p29 isoform X1 n=1 Tax=Elephas maximus indicus TaxID=99487 RepID=UPI00211670DA|nr:ribonuclease P protein subunit p29 isoform X1 [Elephas maximus indicus]